MSLENRIDDLITGSTLLGTGGGGSPKAASEIFAALCAGGPLPEVLPLSSFKAGAVFISAFGVGSIHSRNTAGRVLLEAYRLLKTCLPAAPAAIVPVEIGPLSLAQAFQLAQAAGLPLLDADVVGGRSSPEVFLETITLFNIPRTPLAVSNQDGDGALLLKSSSPQHEEAFLRNFARMSGGNAGVAGYLLSAQDAKQALVQLTVSRSLEAGELLRLRKLKDFERRFEAVCIFRGTITEISDSPDSAFAEHWVEICNSGQTARLYIKNENLVFMVDGEPAVTCPDLIALLDEQGTPLSTADLKTGQPVQVYALPAPALWRSEQGRKLFSPRLFNFNFDARLL